MVDILIKSTPIILAALAVAVPARAGLINVGGEGQLVLGGVAAAGVVRWLGEGTPSAVTLTLMLVAAAIAGRCGPASPVCCARDWASTRP